MNLCEDRTVSRAVYCCFVALLFSAGSVSAHDNDAHPRNSVQELSPAQQEVVAVLEAYRSAYEAADVERLAALTVADESFSFFEGASADWGWGSHAAHLSAEFPAFSAADYRFSDISPVVDETLAYATFAWQLDVVILSEQFEGGRHPVSMTGLGTAVLVKQDGNWKLRHIATARKTQS